MKNWRQVSSLLVTGMLVASAATGCSSEEETNNQGSNESTASKASALTSPVEEAADNPSGLVQAGSVDGIMDAYADFDLATLGGAGMPAGFDIDPHSGVELDCVAGDALAGTVDMACATGGEATGALTYEIAVEGASAWVYHQMDNVCIPAEDICMSGEGAVEVNADGEGASTVVAGNLTLTQGGVTDELRYGVTVGATAAGFTSEVVLWHNGASYVVSTSAGAGGLSYSIEGANGSWSCDLNENGDSGSCINGADSIDF